MNSVHKLTIATMIIAAPSFASAQGKAPHPAPPVVMGKSAPVRQDNRADKIADKAERTADRNADRTARNADKAADKSAHIADKAADKAAAKAERSADKTEHSEFKAAHEQKLLTKGIRLTPAEKKQVKAIEKKYDAQYRSIRKNEVAADNAARKNGTADSDAAFQAQVSQLQVQERAEIRAVLTPEQQAIFDKNVTKLSSHK
jgi:Spy/CpxP family protein refolding chaperone